MITFGRMNTFMEGIEFELIPEELALFCRSGKEVQVKELVTKDDACMY